MTAVAARRDLLRLKAAAARPPVNAAVFKDRALRALDARSAHSKLKLAAQRGLARQNIEQGAREEISLGKRVSTYDWEKARRARLVEMAKQQITRQAEINREWVAWSPSRALQRVHDLRSPGSVPTPAGVQTPGDIIDLLRSKLPGQVEVLPSGKVTLETANQMGITTAEATSAQPLVAMTAKVKASSGVPTWAILGGAAALLLWLTQK